MRNCHACTTRAVENTFGSASGTAASSAGVSGHHHQSYDHAQEASDDRAGKRPGRHGPCEDEPGEQDGDDDYRVLLHERARDAVGDECPNQVLRRSSAGQRKVKCERRRYEQVLEITGIDRVERNAAREYGDGEPGGRNDDAGGRGHRPLEPGPFQDRERSETQGNEREQSQEHRDEAVGDDLISQTAQFTQSAQREGVCDAALVGANQRGRGVRHLTQCEAVEFQYQRPFARLVIREREYRPRQGVLHPRDGRDAIE